MGSGALAKSSGTAGELESGEEAEGNIDRAAGVRDFDVEVLHIASDGLPLTATLSIDGCSHLVVTDGHGRC